MADTDGDMMINPIEFHVLVNRLHGAMEGAKETPFDWLSGAGVPIPSYGTDINALQVPVQDADAITAAGGGVVAVLSARTEEDGLGQGVGAICNAIIRRDWVCAPVVYSDSAKKTLTSFLDKCDGVLVRLSLRDAQAGKYKDFSLKGLKEVLNLVGQTKPVLQAPDTLLSFGSKGALPVLAQPLVTKTPTD